ncbi:MAG: hypothetical protein IGS48_13225 [Oscillatoriales cyanobacterium C42_A2020_001]|nr:hypothetical protein [Leptolyngbyaceae cyanobacterium C42_A2020_001]
MMNVGKRENQLLDLSKKFLTPGRSLLLPMILLALGLHAALLALPIPSSEAQKEADDKKNPITVTQIPTEKPSASTPAAKPAATVEVPPLDTATASESSTSAVSSGASTDSSTSNTASNSASNSAFSSSSDSGSTTSSPTKSSKSSPNQSTDSQPTEEASSNSDSATADASTTAAATSTPEPSTTNSQNTSVVAVSPFANFPHYQPSEADCFGLGFGDNCRTVQNGAIAQVSDFFKRELAAKEFTASLVADEPTRKVFKVGKGDKILFLNIWQGKNQVAYLLSRVIVKQSPEQIKTEAEVR